MIHALGNTLCTNLPLSNWDIQVTSVEELLLVTYFTSGLCDSTIEQEMTKLTKEMH